MRMNRRLVAPGRRADYYPGLRYRLLRTLVVNDIHSFRTTESQGATSR
jgi:hypothetical protein